MRETTGYSHDSTVGPSLLYNTVVVITHNIPLGQRPVTYTVDTLVSEKFQKGKFYGQAKMRY